MKNISQASEPTKGNDAQPVSWLKKLGPGLITDAQFGFNILWTELLTYLDGWHPDEQRKNRPGQCHGLATNIRQHFPPGLLYKILGLLLVANTINIAAVAAAMAAALKLIIGGFTHL